MSSAIIDIQCVVASDLSYLIKEMSIVGIQSMATQHFIFKHNNISQNEKSRGVNKWLENNYHGLSLDYGDINYEEIDRIINSFRFKYIYVKGKQKQKIIKQFIPHIDVIDLEELDCPRQAELCVEDHLPFCIFHNDKTYSTQCTFHKIYAMKKWFINNIEL